MTQTENHSTRRSLSTAADQELQALLSSALGLSPCTTAQLQGSRELDSLLEYRHKSNPGTAEGSQPSPNRRDATTWTLIDLALNDVRDCLNRHDLQFVLLKGAATSQLYPAPFLRRASDLDILVNPTEFDAVRAALEADGWRSAIQGRYAERYLREEGSCWQARLDARAVVEVHFRFWGSVPDSLTEDVVRQASRGDGGDLEPAPHHSLLIAAAHWWRQPRPRRATDLVDIGMLLQRHDAHRFEHLTRSEALHGQHLPVCLALLLLDPVLEQTHLRKFIACIEDMLHPAERSLVERLRAKGSHDISWRALRLAMLRARRPSRAGWRSVWRQLWPHPGVLEQKLPGDASWARKRLAMSLRGLRRARPTR